MATPQWTSELKQLAKSLQAEADQLAILASNARGSGEIRLHPSGVNAIALGLERISKRLIALAEEMQKGTEQ